MCFESLMLPSPPPLSTASPGAASPQYSSPPAGYSSLRTSPLQGGLLCVALDSEGGVGTVVSRCRFWKQLCFSV